MPRCQRTFRGLSDEVVNAITGGAKWSCPHCAEKEIYETVTAPDLLQYATLARATAFRDFGPPADASYPFVLIWGQSPECIYEPEERQYNLYLQTGSDPYQARLQIGHEMFHRVCSQGKIFHWTHEMLACVFSVRLLRQSGATEYALQTDHEYRVQAQSCSLEEMTTTDLVQGPYPRGLYGRAYCTGVDLVARFGWAALCRLPRTLGTTGLPDMRAWLSAVGGSPDF